MRSLSLGSAADLNPRHRPSVWPHQPCRVFVALPTGALQPGPSPKSSSSSTRSLPDAPPPQHLQLMANMACDPAVSPSFWLCPPVLAGGSLRCHLGQSRRARLEQLPAGLRSPPPPRDRRHNHIPFFTGSPFPGSQPLPVHLQPGVSWDPSPFEILVLQTLWQSRLPGDPQGTPNTHVYLPPGSADLSSSLGWEPGGGGQLPHRCLFRPSTGHTGTSSHTHGMSHSFIQKRVLLGSTRTDRTGWSQKRRGESACRCTGRRSDER